MKPTLELMARFVGMMRETSDPLESKLEWSSQLMRALMRAEARLQASRLISVAPADPRRHVIPRYVEALTTAAEYAWLLFGDDDEAAGTAAEGEAAMDALDSAIEEFNGLFDVAVPGLQSTRGPVQ